MNDLESTVIAAQNRDAEAFSRLFASFRDTAYVFASGWLNKKDLVEEAVQDAFVEVFFNLPSLQQPSAFPAWLRVIVFRCCDRLIRGKQLQTVPLTEVTDTDVEATDPETLLETKELEGWLQKGLLRLKQQERQALSLFYLAGYRQEEIASVFHEPVGRIRKRLFDARRRLREHLTDEVEHFLPDLHLSLNDRYLGQAEEKVLGFALGEDTDLAELLNLTWDGTNNYIESQAPLTVATNQMTLEAWIRPTHESADEYKIAHFHEVLNQDVWLSLQWGQLWFGINDPSGAAHKLRTQRLRINRWYHVAGTYDGRIMRLFVDGAAVRSFAFIENRSFTAGFDVVGPLYVGVNGYAVKNDLFTVPGEPQLFPGLLAEVRVWDCARSPAQIRNAMSKMLRGNERGLLVYYSFGRSNTTLIPNVTRRGFNGRLVRV